MKSIFRTMAVVAALLCVLSCRMDFLYVQVPDTSWNITKDDQRAFVHFSQERASLLQRENSSGLVKVLHGDYSTRGHVINISVDNADNVKITRTFSHLKNASNKNYSPFWPEACSLEQTVWHTLYRDSLRILYFRNGAVHRYSFSNVERREGIPSVWSKDRSSYSVAGNQVSMGDDTATLFPEVMLVGDHWYMHFVQPMESGCNEMTGSLWTLQGGGYPGCILFDSNSTFTRISLISNVLYQADRGTYSRSGDVLTLTLGDVTQECPVSGDSFEFLDKTYEIFN